MTLFYNIFNRVYINLIIKIFNYWEKDKNVGKSDSFFRTSYSNLNIHFSLYTIISYIYVGFIDVSLRKIH